MKKVLTAFALLFALGCGKTFYSHIEGENDMIGVKLPVESDIQLDVVHHINGTTMTVKDASYIIHNYVVSNSNSYCGIVHINEFRSGNITVCPTNCMNQLKK